MCQNHNFKTTEKNPFNSHQRTINYVELIVLNFSDCFIKYKELIVFS